MLKLMSFANAVAPYEFSGFGFVNRKGNDLEVYDCVILDVGSQGYTEIPQKKLLELMERKDYANMKLWLHRHPINTWSGTDLHTILKEPLGGVPEMVKWSASDGLTPRGWIGRVDNYVKKTTQVCPVLPTLEGIYTLKTELAGKKNFVSASHGSNLDQTIYAQTPRPLEDLDVVCRDVEDLLGNIDGTDTFMMTIPTWSTISRRECSFPQNTPMSPMR